MEDLPVAAVLLEPGGTVVVAANDRAVRILRAGRPVTGSDLRALVAEADRDALADLGAGDAAGPLVIRRAAEPPAWLELHVGVTGGRPLVLLHDVTDRVRTFRVLRESVLTIAIVDEQSARRWGPVGRDHPEGRPASIPGSAVDRLHPEDVADVIALWTTVLAEPGRHGQVHCRLQDHHLSDEWGYGTVSVANLSHVPEVGGMLIWLQERAPTTVVPSIARTSEAYLSVAEAAPVGIILTGPAGYPFYFNEAVRTLLPGVGPGAADREWIDRVAPEERAEVQAWFDDLVAAQAGASRTVCFPGPDGVRRWALVTVAPRRHEEGTTPAGFVVTLQDVTSEVTIRHELEEAQAQLLEMATHDPLTGLANRSLVAGLARREGEVPPAPDGAGLGALYCDLDGFKAVNDRLGHEAGDAVLVEVAGRLRAVARQEDLVARLGGDEFLVLARSVTDDALTTLAERIAGAVTEPIAVAGEHVRVGISVGTAVQVPGETLDDLLRRADRAMYRVKVTARA